MRVRQVVPRDAIPSVDNPVFGPDHTGDPGDRWACVGPGGPRSKGGRRWPGVWRRGGRRAGRNDRGQRRRAHASGSGARTPSSLPPGGGLHTFENPGFEFEAAGGGRFRADGTTWDLATGEATDGRHLTRLPVRRLFAFAWQDDHGPDAFYEGG